MYYSRNGKKSPFIVTIKIIGQLAYIECDCVLGLEKKICRHKINAVRANREHSHTDTSDEVLSRLRGLFGIHTALRQHLEIEWEKIRMYSYQNPENEEEIGNRRKALGETLANGFKF